MASDPALIPRAARYEPAAVRELLQTYYPAVCRIAGGLCGRPASARSVTQIVMNRSLHLLYKWQDELDAANWFTHHTVLMCRHAKRARPGERFDLLLPAEVLQNPDYVPFIAALRALPFQQMEAIVLNYGERLDPRALAVAMDCSTQAAGNHIVAATHRLTELFQAKLPRVLNTLGRVYSGLNPPEELVVGDVRRTVRRHVCRRRLNRYVLTPLMILILAALAYFGWRLSKMIVY